MKRAASGVQSTYVQYMCVSVRLCKPELTYRSSRWIHPQLPSWCQVFVDAIQCPEHIRPSHFGVLRVLRGDVQLRVRVITGRVVFVNAAIDETTLAFFVSLFGLPVATKPLLPCLRERGKEEDESDSQRSHVFAFFLRNQIRFGSLVVERKESINGSKKETRNEEGRRKKKLY